MNNTLKAGGCHSLGFPEGLNKGMFLGRPSRTKQNNTMKIRWCPLLSLIYILTNFNLIKDRHSQENSIAPLLETLALDIWRTQACGCLHIVNRVRCLNIKSDRLACQGLDKDLHSSTQAQHKVECGLLLDVVVWQGATILQLLSSEDQALLIWWDPFLVLDLGLVDTLDIGMMQLLEERYRYEWIGGFPKWGITRSARKGSIQSISQQGWL